MNRVNDQKAEMRSEGAVTGFCLKCRESRDIQEPEQVILKNNRSAVRGTCAVCGTGMFRIGRAPERG